MMKFAAMNGVGAMIVQVILHQVHMTNQEGSNIMQRLTGFEMGSPMTGKYSTTDVLTILVFPGSHINRQWEEATTSDTSLPETSALLKREGVINEKWPLRSKMIIPTCAETEEDNKYDCHITRWNVVIR
jgi:hypothetical protein